HSFPTRRSSDLEEYRAAHVTGAVSIPLDELEQRLRELPRDREIVAYCRGPYCAFAPEAVRTLREQGYTARHLSQGLPEWAAAGNGVASTSAHPTTARALDRMRVRNNRRLHA